MFKRPVRLHWLRRRTAAPLVLLAQCLAMASPTGFAAGNFGCTTPFTTPTISSSFASDNPGVSLQDDVDCYAWQTFIALNWRADPAMRGEPDKSATAADFGQPDDLSPTVWASYKQAGEVFVAEGVPKTWNDAEPLPPACRQLAGSPATGHLLRMTSKFSADQVLDSELEAGANAWLTAQNRTLVRYEKRMNRDEFNYVVQNRLFRDACQARQASTAGLSLPDGSQSQYGSQGAIEIKAAWLELTEADRPRWNRFKRMQAYILESPSQCRAATMGLVGLHIIHKTASFPQLMWATFEQVDNAPTLGEEQLQDHYSFYDPQCAGVGPGDVCPPTADPACQCNRVPAKDDPKDRPVQVARVNRISDRVQALNQAVHALIAAANPDSVWQYYRLVDVSWPKDSDQVARPGAILPLYAGAPSSNGLKVANVTLETYLQSRTCQDCHQSARIAGPQPPPGTPALAADFSFLFDDAKQGGTTREVNEPCHE